MRSKPRTTETNTVAARSSLMGRQATWVAGLIVLAIGLRTWEIDQVSLNHFDEGVFVSGAFGVWLHGLWHFPLSQALQAPPLFPWMIAGSFGLTRTASPLIAIYLCAAIGSATVILFWALLRRLHGLRFALIAATLLATSDLHIAFSRMALTDVPLTFWLVASAYCFLRTIEASRLADPSVKQSSVTRIRRHRPAVAWSIATGLTAGAAWNTKYNGWMFIAILATAWLLVAARTLLMKRYRSGASDSGRDVPFARLSVVLAIAVAALIAAACFCPWYLHVERAFDGGYREVTANHLSYFGGVAAWPARAARLWLSLTAFRHFGWIATTAGLLIAAICYHVRRTTCCGAGVPPAFADEDSAPVPQIRRGSRTELAFTLLASITVLVAMFALGSDAVITAFAAAAIVPALIWGGWAAVVFAVWAASFLIMTPFYHPYTRLLVPALPAEIALTVWLVARAVGHDQSDLPIGQGIKATAARSTCRVMMGLACGGVLIAALVSRPFGWVPSRGAWSRWSTRQSYRALGEAVRESPLPANVVVLCQGPPAMNLYLDREFAPLELVPFHFWLPHVDRGRECYLAADFWGLYGENHQAAYDSLRARIRCLEPVAVVSNDLNLITLLDYLPAAEVADHVSSAWPPKYAESKVQSPKSKVIIPADVTEHHADIIVLYRVDRECLDELGQ